MQNSPAARQAVVVGAGFAGAVTARELDVYKRQP